MIAVRFDHVTKEYDLQAGRRTVFSMLKMMEGSRPSEAFRALSDVSFEVHKGESLGIIGRNGSGKTTILKLIAGITQPTAGSVTVHGRVSSLIELGAGFHPDLSGRENVYMNAATLGIPRRLVDAKFKEIVDFAELWEFIDVPVKRYSSGMFARLGFAVASHVDPEILIVDEALSVGDMFFQAKCMARIHPMIEAGVTLLFVSHDVGAVKSLCDRVLLLERGVLLEAGPPEFVVEKYFSLKVRSEQQIRETSEPYEVADEHQPGDQHPLYVYDKIFRNNAEFQRRASYQRIRNGKAHFVNVQLLNGSAGLASIIEYGQTLVLRMAIEACTELPALLYGYHIRDRNGIDVVYADCAIENMPFLSMKKGDRYVIDWEFDATLAYGNYNIACVLSVPINLELSQVEFCDFVPLAAQFQMNARKGSYLYGLVHWHNSVAIHKHISSE